MRGPDGGESCITSVNVVLTTQGRGLPVGHTRPHDMHLSGNNYVSKCDRLLEQQRVMGVRYASYLSLCTFGADELCSQTKMHVWSVCLMKVSVGHRVWEDLSSAKSNVKRQWGRSIRQKYSFGGILCTPHGR